MNRSLFDELKKTIRDQTVAPDAMVSNLQGVLADTPVLDENSVGTQAWYVMQVPFGALPSLRDFADAHSRERLPVSQISGASGKAVFPAGGVLSPGYATLLYTSFSSASAARLPVSVRAPGHAVALYTDNVLNQSGTNGIDTNLDLSAGDHFLAVIAFGGASPIEVTVAGNATLTAAEPTPAPPILSGQPTATYLKAQNGSYVTKVSWLNDAFASGWQVYRADAVNMGAIISSTLSNGIMTVRVPTDVTAVVAEGSQFYTNLFYGGPIIKVTAGVDGSSNPITDLLVRVSDEAPTTSWVGLQFWRSSNSFQSIGRVSYSGTPLMTYLDVTNAEGQVYLYRVTAFGFITGTTESDYSSTGFVSVGDIGAPGVITLASVDVIDGTAYAQYTAPVDLDFRGVRVYRFNGGAYTPVSSQQTTPGSKNVLAFIPPAADTYWFRTFDWAGNEQPQGSGASWVWDGLPKYASPLTPVIVPTVNKGTATLDLAITISGLAARFPATLQIFKDQITTPMVLTGGVTSLSVGAAGTTDKTTNSALGTIALPLTDASTYWAKVTDRDGHVTMATTGPVTRGGIPGGQVTVDDYKSQPVFNLTYTDDVTQIVVKKGATVKTTLTRSSGLVSSGKGTATFTVAVGDALAVGVTDAGWTVEYTGPGATLIMWAGSLHGDKPLPPRFDFISAVIDAAAADQPRYDITAKVIDPSGLGGTLSVWLNKDGVASANPTVAADYTLAIAAVNMPFTANPTTNFSPGPFTALNNVKGSYTVPKSVYLEFVNTAGGSTGKIEFQIFGDLGTILNADGTLKPIGKANFASTIKPVEIYATLPTSGQGANGDVAFAADTGRLYRKVAGVWVSYTTFTNLEGQIVSTQITDDSVTSAKIVADSATFGKVAGAAANFTNTVTALLTARAIDAGKINVAQISDFKFVQYSGKVSAPNTTNTITVTSQAGANPAWTTNQWVGYKITVSNAAGISQNEYTVTANTGNTITISGTWSTTPDATYTFGLSNGAGLGIFVGGQLKSALLDSNGNSVAVLDLNATGTNPILYSQSFTLNADGTASYSGNVTADSLASNYLNVGTYSATPANNITGVARVNGNLEVRSLNVQQDGLWNDITQARMAFTAGALVLYDAPITGKVAVATATTDSTITLKNSVSGNPNWAPDQFSAQQATLVINGTSYTIVSNTGNTITISGTFGAVHAVDTAYQIRNVVNAQWGSYTTPTTGATPKSDNSWNVASSSIARSTTGNSVNQPNPAYNDLTTVDLPSTSQQYTITFTLQLDSSSVAAAISSSTNGTEINIDGNVQVYYSLTGSNAGSAIFPLFNRTINHYIYAGPAPAPSAMTGTNETITITQTVTVPTAGTSVRFVLVPSINYTRTGTGTGGGTATVTVTGGNITWVKGGAAGTTRRSLRLFTQDADVFSPALSFEPLPSAPTAARGRIGDVVFAGGGLLFHNGSVWVSIGGGAPAVHTHTWSDITGTATATANFATMILGTDPGGTDLLRVGGASTLGGETTVNGRIRITGSLGGVGAAVRYIGHGGSTTTMYLNVPTGGQFTFGVNETASFTVSAGGATSAGNLQLQGGASAQPQLQWTPTGTTVKWVQYMTSATDPNIYLRDITNSRMQVTYAPGADSTAALTTFNSGLNVQGNLTVVGTFALGPSGTISGASGVNRGVQLLTAGSLRWFIFADNGPETPGTAAGSNFAISRYNDGGGFVANAFAINRATGLVSIGGTTLTLDASSATIAASTVSVYGLSFTNNGTAIRARVGSLLVSGSYANDNLVPTNGIYSSGTIVSGVGITVGTQVSWAGLAGILNATGGTGSIASGVTVTSQGTVSPNVNIYARNDSGAAGHGVIISYFDSSASSVWRAALDVRNAAGLSTLNLMPAGGTINLGGIVNVGDITNGVSLASVVALWRSATYTVLNTAAGVAALYLGGSDPANYYRNATHYFQSAAATPYATLDSGTFAIATGIRQFGSLIARFENTGGSVPSGCTGPGVELGVTGGTTGYVQAYNRTSAAYSNLSFYAAQFDFAISGVGKVQISNTLMSTVINISAPDFILSSDERLKTSLLRIDSPLTRLTAINGYTFEYTADRSRRRAGVIAQEVQKVLPEAVVTGEDGMLSVSYDALVPLLIEAIKELQKEVRRGNA